jgi:5-methylcytosine-specific restriction endonuclease McrA
MDTAEESKRQRAREAQARYRARHPERCREATKKSIAKHPKPPGWRRDYYQRNKSKWKTDPVKNRERARKWYLNNRVKALNRIRARYQIKKDEILAHKRSHPEQGRMYAAIRRARTRTSPENAALIKAWAARIFENGSPPCYYCRKKLTPVEVRFDHIVAVSKGGSHSLDNLCVSCHDCNSSKYNKPLQEWCRDGQQVLSL